jgi:hypothetical protein
VTAETPGQVASEPPPLYAQWVRADCPDATDDKVARLWRAASEGDRQFWADLIAAQEPKPAPGTAVATFGYDGCLTPDAVYATYIGTERLSVTVDYGRELPIGEDDAGVLDSALHDALESALAPYFGAAPAGPQPAPELAAQPPSPQPDGTIVIGPQCFADKHREVISWQGENYYALANEDRVLAARRTADAKPAPELRAAMAETRTVLGYLDDFTHAVIDIDAGFGGKLAKAATALRKKAGLPPVDAR